MTVTQVDRDRWPEPKQTGNAVLLEGYLCGAIAGDPLYRIVERLDADEGTTIESRDSGNRYLLHVVQISGTE